MINKISKKLSNELIQKGIILKDQIDVYEYGFDIFISSIINLFIIIVIFLKFNILVETIVYMLFFAALRFSTGGFHIKNHFLCLITYLLFGSLSYLLYSYIINSNILLLQNFVCAVCCLISLILVYCFAPVDNENRRHSKNEYKIFRNRSLITICIEVLIILVGYMAGGYVENICVLASFGMIIQSISLLPFLNKSN